jgi:hypothetical protein
MIRFGQDVCGNLEAGLRREWLETNGLGGFASSTINGINTRRYHGLLVAATKPPVGRVVLLSKLEETLLVDGRSFDLSANRYPGVVHPQGFRFLKQFRLDPFPVFTFEVEGVKIEKTVFMVQGENTTVVQYEIKDSAAVLSDKIALEIRPLIPATCQYYALTKRTRICQDPNSRDRPIHRREGRAEDSHCRLPLVQRLGSRHHDRVTRPHFTDQAL